MTLRRSGKIIRDRMASMPQHSFKIHDKIKPVTGSAINWGHPLKHNSPCLFIGSCFSEVIAMKLKDLKFPALTNPAGIIFDPISISKCLHRVVSGHRYTESDIFTDSLQPDVYHSWDHHSSFSSVLKHDLVNRMNRHIREALEQVKRAEAMFITLGTATVHCLRENDSVVANCHKR